MRKILIIIGCLFFALFSTPRVWAEKIDNFSGNISVNKNGTINVEERIAYDFGLKRLHGIFREIPYIKTNKQGKKYKLEIESISVKDNQGKPYQYKETDENNQIKLKIGDPNKTITGVHIYIIKYRVKGGITYFSDHDELYWNATGNNWPVPISFSTFKVKLPVGMGQTKIKASCYTGSLNSQASDCQVSYNKNEGVFSSTKPLLAYQGLSVVVNFPKDIVSFAPAKEYVPFWETFLGKVVKSLLIIVIILIVLFWYIIYPVRIIYKWWRYGRDPDARSGQTSQSDSGQAPSGEVTAWYDPPRTKDGRLLTPAEVGSLIDETVDVRDIFSILIDLSRRGYFKIEERKKGDFYFIRQDSSTKKKEKKLLPFEKQMIDDLFKTKKEVRLKDKELYSTIKRVKGLLYSQLVDDGFFPKDPSKIRLFYTIISVFALSTANLPLFLVALIFGRHMPRKTILGVKVANIGRSLKNFLSSQKRQLEFQAKKQMMFEKLLPYAAAFGVEKIWAKRFADFNLKSPDWYQSYDQAGQFNSAMFISSMNRSYSSVNSSAVSPTTSSSGFSSGGFSGGGGGGGGGGSW